MNVNTDQRSRYGFTCDTLGSNFNARIGTDSQIIVFMIARLRLPTKDLRMLNDTPTRTQGDFAEIGCHFQMRHFAENLLGARTVKVEERGMKGQWSDE